MLDRLQEERSKLIEFVDETLSRANDDGRDLVDAEQRNLKTSQERIAQLDAQIEPMVTFEGIRASQARMDRTPAPQRTQHGEQFRSFGDLYIDSEGYQQRGWQGRAQLEDVDALELAMQTRATLSTVATPGSGYLPKPARFTTSVPEFSTPLLDAVTKVSVSTGSVDILTWGELTGSTEVPEGTAKPELSAVNGSTTLALKTIAGWVKYTRQLAEDAPGFAAFLNQGITRDLLRKLQANLAAAIAAAAIPTTTGAAGKPMIEVVRLGMAKVEEAGFTPNVLIASPTVLAGLDISVLNLGGSAASVMGTGQWSLTPVPVPGLASVYVADAADAFVMFTRSGIHIYTTDSDVSGATATTTSDFRANILTTLGETRGQGAVQNPNAATKCVTTP
jgi:hypothetical protein